MIQNRFSTWGKQLLGSLNVTPAILSGYFLAIVVVVMGSLIGVMMGNQIQTRAYHHLTLIQEQESLVNQLENTLLDLQVYPLGLLDGTNRFPVSLETIQLPRLFPSLRISAQQNIDKLQQFVELAQPTDLAEDKHVFQNLLQHYQATISQQDNLIQSLEPTPIKPHQELEPDFQPRQQVANGQTTHILAQDKYKYIETYHEFIWLYQQFNPIVEVAKLQSLQAKVDFAKAQHYFLEIILFSILTSGIIATMLVQSVQRYDQQQFQLMQAHLEQLTQDLKQTLENLQTTQNQLIQTEKLSSLGQMVAGIAHEINNPINFIYGNLAFAQDYVHELIELLRLFEASYPQPTPELVDKMKELDIDFLRSDLPQVLGALNLGTERIYKIVCSLRNFSRSDTQTVENVDLHAGIDSTLTILNHRLKRGVTVTKDYGDLPLISCYPAQLNQVFMNLITNALDAMEMARLADKRITIATQFIPNQGQVIIHVKDNGPGIPPDIQAKIFDPFFTTKPIGKGTGLGLDICSQIIQKHRGEITMDSSVGQGTEFRISLPLK
jgi:signal transduction histidine kinase